jgi:hypothetical protein
MLRMPRRIVLVVVALLAAGVGLDPGGSAAASAGTGQAFTIDEVTTTLYGGSGSSVHLGLTNTTAEGLSFAAGSGPSSFQVVATGRPGRQVEVRLTGATAIITHDSWPPLVSRTDCTPAGDDNLLGTVLIGRLPRSGAATGLVDAAIPVTCHYLPEDWRT